MANGWTYGEIRKLVIDLVSGNAINANCMNELYLVFGLDPTDIWINRSHLLQAIKNSHNKFAFEEAARILIDPYICYSEGSGYYYVYG